MSLDAIINEWDFGDKEKAFSMLVEESQKMQEKVKELNNILSKQYYSGNNDKDKKILFSAVKKTDWFKQQMQNIKDRYAHDNEEYIYNGGM